LQPGELRIVNAGATCHPENADGKFLIVYLCATQGQALFKLDHVMERFAAAVTALAHPINSDQA
jgi:hypothetical protein